MAKKLDHNNHEYIIGVQFTKQIDNKYHLTVRLVTKSTIQLALKFNDWSVKKKSQLPIKILNLNPTTLLNWHIDDGCFNKDKRSYSKKTKKYKSGDLEFSTDSFKESEVKLLASLINDKFDTNFYVKLKKKSGGLKEGLKKMLRLLLI